MALCKSFYFSKSCREQILLRVVGEQAQLNFLRRISQSEIRILAAAESEGGQKFIPPNPLPFCPPERSVWRAKRAVSSVQKRFAHFQTKGRAKQGGQGIIVVVLLPNTRMSQKEAEILLQHMSPTGLCRDVGNAYNVLTQAVAREDMDGAKEVVKMWGDEALPLYRHYFQKYGDDAAEAVVQASDAAQVAAFDRIIEDVNARLSEATVNRNFEQLQQWCAELNALVDDGERGIE